MAGSAGGFKLPPLSDLSDCTRTASQTFAGQLYLRTLETAVLVAVLPVASADVRGQQVLDLLHQSRAFQTEVLRTIAGRARGRAKRCAACVPGALATSFFGGLWCGRPCLGRRDSVHRLGRQFFDLPSESRDRSHRVFHEVR